MPESLFLVVTSRVRLGERLRGKEWIGLAIVVGSLVSVSSSLGGRSDVVGLMGSGSRVLAAVLPTFAVVVIIVALIQAGRGTSGFLYDRLPACSMVRRRSGRKARRRFSYGKGYGRVCPVSWNRSIRMSF